MKYYIIAGEASGDLHGSNLVKALHKFDNQAEIWAWGGDMMRDAGAEIRKHYRDLAFMGFIEVVKNLRTILGNINFCKKDILEFNPDVIIFVDYPGFNLRIAKWAKQQGIRTFYYISPQIWAWHTSRVHGIKASVDKMFCILPFEKDFYKQYNYEVDYVGHPLLDVIENRPVNTNFRKDMALSDAPIIAILPGSRRQEVTIKLPIMLSIISEFPDYQFVIATAPSLPQDFYENIIQSSAIKGTEKVKLLRGGHTYDLLQHAKAALVKSGTSTLETALFGVPEVVCYKGSPISYRIAKRVIKVKYISLVNLIADKMIVKELIQDDFNKENLVKSLKEAIENEAEMKKNYAHLRTLLGECGASDRAGKLMVDYLKG